MSAENGKIRFPKTDNPIIYPPSGSFYVWIAMDGAMKKMDENGVVTNLSAQSISDMTDVNLTGLQNGQVLTWSDSLQKWIASDIILPTTTYLALDDVDDSTFIGSAGKVPTVNAEEDGLEFTDKLAGASLTHARYKYQTATSTMQGQGKIRFNNSDISLATQFQINTVDANGSDLEAFLTTFIDESFNLFLQDELDRSSAVKVSITSGGTLNANGNTFTYDCTFDKATDIALIDGANCNVVFSARVDTLTGYTGIDAIDVNNNAETVALKLSEDTSGQFDSMSVSLFNDAYNHNYQVVKRHGKRINIGLDLLGPQMIINYDSGEYQLYRSTVHDDRFIGFCEEIGYWIAVSLNTPYSFGAAYQETITVFHGSWVQLGTACSLLPNGNKVPSGEFVTFAGENGDNSYLEQSTDGLKAKVAATIETAEAFELADALDVRQAIEALTARMDANEVIISGWRQFDVIPCLDWPTDYQYLDNGGYVGSPFAAYRRVGENIEVTFAWRQSGQYTGDNRRIYFSLPEGLTANWAAIPPKQGGINITFGEQYFQLATPNSPSIVGIESEGDNVGKIMFLSGGFIRWSDLANNAIVMTCFSVAVVEWRRTGIIDENLE